MCAVITPCKTAARAETAKESQTAGWGSSTPLKLKYMSIIGIHPGAGVGTSTNIRNLQNFAASLQDGGEPWMITGNSNLFPKDLIESRRLGGIQGQIRTPSIVQYTAYAGSGRMFDYNVFSPSAMRCLDCFEADDSGKCEGNRNLTKYASQSRRAKALHDSPPLSPPTIADLNDGLRKQSNNKGLGCGSVAPQDIKHLPDEGKQVLIDMMNESEHIGAWPKLYLNLVKRLHKPPLATEPSGWRRGRSDFARQLAKVPR